MGKYGLDNINKPAYDAAHEEIEELRGEVPTDAEITALANAAIQGDKDILSKITVEYDETSNATFIRFPKNVFPTRFNLSYGSGMIYYLVKFYQGEFYFVNSSNENAGVVSISNNILSLSIAGADVSSQWKDKINKLEYILFNGDVLDYKSINWYNIYNTPSSGTKLYKHQSVSGNYIINVYSTTSKSITSFSSTSDALKDIIYVGANYREGSTSYDLIPLFVSAGYYPPLSFSAKLLSLQDLSNLSIVNLNSITSDTVTPL